VWTTGSFPEARASSGELIMRKVAEYELRAEECRRRAAQMKDPEQKKQLEDMAQAWVLARARTKHLERGWGEPPRVRHADFSYPYPAAIIKPSADGSRPSSS
jgi:hypothetical protein